MLSLVCLRSFLAVTRYGSFTRAAYQLDLSQPAVSGHIAQLEEDLGTPVFNRVGRKVVLTDAGRILKSCAQDIEDRLNGLNRELADLKTHKGGEIRLGASRIAGGYILPNILAGFRRQYPDIELHLAVHSAFQIVAGVESNTFDLAIVTEGRRSLSPNVLEKAIGIDELVVVAPLSFAREHGVAPGEICSITREEASQTPFILFGAKTASSQAIDRELKRLKLQLNCTFDMNDAGAIKRAVEEGAGLAIISKEVVQHELQEKRLVQVDIEGWRPQRKIFMLWRQDRPFSHNTAAFMKYLRRALKPTTEPTKQAHV